MIQDDLFDKDKGCERRDTGKARAAMKHYKDLLRARDIAKTLALIDPDRCVSADQVQAKLLPLGIKLGNAAGSIFNGGAWEFTGRFIKSTRASNRARYVRVWHLRITS